MSIHPSPSQTTADDNPSPRNIGTEYQTQKIRKRKSIDDLPPSPPVQRPNPRHPFRPFGTPSPDSMPTTIRTPDPFLREETIRQHLVRAKQESPAKAISLRLFHRHFIQEVRFASSDEKLVARPYDSLPLIRRGDSPLRATGESEQGGQNATVYFKVPIADSYSRSRAFRMAFPKLPHENERPRPRSMVAED